MFVLDTNTLIYFFKGVGNVPARLLQTPPRDISIPSIVLFELETGIARSSSPKRRAKQLAALVSAVNVLPFGPVEAQRAAQIRVDLEKRGQSIGPHDVLIAATAQANHSTLVTHNVAEFKRVEQLCIEDWF